MRSHCTSGGLRARALLALALVNAGCDALDRGVAACDPGMPTAAQLLVELSFASLRYHQQQAFEVMRGAGYDLWADGKFEYRSAMQFTLVPKGGSAGQLCAHEVALRVATPLDGERREMLATFVRSVAGRASWDAKALQSEIDKRVAAGEKYRPIEREAAVKVEAGAVSHRARGDYFVVAFTWPRQLAR